MLYRQYNEVAPRGTRLRKTVPEFTYSTCLTFPFIIKVFYLLVR